MTYFEPVHTEYERKNNPIRNLCVTGLFWAGATKSNKPWIIFQARRIIDPLWSNIQFSGETTREQSDSWQHSAPKKQLTALNIFKLGQGEIFPRDGPKFYLNFPYQWPNFDPNFRQKFSIVFQNINIFSQNEITTWKILKTLWLWQWWKTV